MNTRRLILTMLATLCGLIIGALSVTAVSAFALKGYVPAGVVSFGEPGVEAGHLEGPEGVAVDSATKHVYVADVGNDRIDEFDATGTFIRAWGWGVAGGIGFETCTTTCFKGLSGSSPGEFESPAFVAVDNSTGVSRGDVYVGDVGDNVITKFTDSGALIESWGTSGQLREAGGEAFGALHGVAVDLSGDLWAYHSEAEKDVNELSDTGAFIKTFDTHRGGGSGIAVDSSEDFYAVNGEPKVSKYKAATDAEVAEFGTGVTALTINPSTNNVLVDQGSSIALYGPFAEPSETPVQTFPSEPEPPLSESNGIAVEGATSTAYVSQRGADNIDVFNLVPFPEVETASVTEASVTLHGEIDLEGETVSECRYEYGTEPGVFPNSAPCEQATPLSGSGPTALSATVTGLEARTTYHFRLTVVAGGHPRSSGELSFFSSTKPLVEEEAVTEVSTSSATLTARINPAGLQTSYRFEYGPSEAYDASLPLPEGKVGAGLTTSSVVSVQPEGLQANTTYHYRAVAANSLGTMHGEDKTFKTPSQGTAFTLPDGRAWEMVSPPDKHGGFIRPLIIEDDVQASAEGSAFTYLSEQSLLSEAKGAAIFDQVMARRTPGGWSDKDISPPHDAPLGQGVGDGQEYHLFSPDLSLALLQPFGGFTPLSPEATERTPYIRDNASGSYLPLLTSANVPPGTKFGGNPTETKLAAPVAVTDATPDLSHVVLRTEGVSLTEATVTDGLYEWSADGLQLVSALPEGEGGEPAAFQNLYLGGEGERDVSHAMADDGARIVWHGENQANEQHLYVHDATDGKSFRLDNVQSGAGNGNIEPSFQAASTDGSKVFFTDEQQLTADSGASGRDLYECDVIETAGALTCQLTDLTPAKGAGSAEVIHGVAVLGASEDGSYLYVVANGVLAGNENEANTTQEKATSGAYNLYVMHSEGADWTTSFIAKLSEEEVQSIERSMVPRVSPSGHYFAFMTENGVTGYDNHDVNSGQPDEEVFLYDATAKPHLICASCDPTGARPLGRHEQPPLARLNRVDSPETWRGSWVAANVPTQEDFEIGQGRYQPRYLLNNGRLYLNSIDSLVPQAVSGQWNVYQYEPTGVGSCGEEGNTVDEQLAGCVNLISSGNSSQESAFLGASETGGRDAEGYEGGGDVFFLTAARLALQDTDEHPDVYDAHECSASSPCIASPTVGAPATCTEGETCRPGATRETPVFGPPASAGLSGAGNLEPAKTKQVVKPLTRAQKLSKALKACRRKPKRKRPACERQARRSYGPVHQAKRPHKGGKS
jgi:DNA-binding beta-propeller fold protein YncE